MKAIKVNCTITYWSENTGVNIDNVGEVITDSLSMFITRKPIPANINIHEIKEVELSPIDSDGSYFE
jgi:hypothetical protein